jgi:hypothetical protein
MSWYLVKHRDNFTFCHITYSTKPFHIIHHPTVRGPFEKFVDWRQCAAVMQREAVTVMSSCSGEGNVVVT